MRRHLAVAVLTSLEPRLVAAPESAILQLQVVEGEGAIHPAGSKASRPITVQVTDETGRPVPGAAVSFRLPDAEVTGSFKAGMKTDVVVTANNGQASIWGIQWGPLPGPVRIRVTAVKDQARAGAVVQLYLSESGKAARTTGPRAGPGRGRWKWIAVAGGAAVAGASAMLFAGGNGGVAGAPGPAVVAGPRVQVGAPSITVVAP